VRYLINEKCKCSEDMRRELILGGSIVELILIVMVFVTAMLIPVTGNCVNSAITSIPNTASEIKKTVQDPLSSIKKTPSNIKKVVSSFSSNSKKVFNSANKVIKKK
jgi:predicted PurR-regulated permease PerM